MSIQLHPFSVAVGAVTVAAVGLLSGGGGGPAGPSPLDFMSVVQIDDGKGNMIDTVRFTGCNVQVVNGMDDTETINGAGNLIVGYNEFREGILYGDPPENDRTGSHNVVGGTGNNYLSHGGLVVGFQNTISGSHASVSGGGGHNASGFASSISGGGRFADGLYWRYVPPEGNTASGMFSSVSGGYNNEAGESSPSAPGHQGPSSISGGCNQIADQECQHLPCNQCPADTNADGVVNGDDFLAVIMAWGTVCP
jgi:hypothetical protein